MSLTPLRSRGSAPCLLALACLSLAGCTETHLYSGHPPGTPPRGFDERWHSSYLFGTTNGGWSYKLDNLCPDGWSEVALTHDTFTVVLSLATLFLYTPTRVTIVCARSPGPLESPREIELYPQPASVYDD